MLLGSKAVGTVGVMAGVPAVLTAFHRSLVKMLIYSREALCNDRQYIHYEEAPFSDHGPARNHLVGSFLGDWLLMLDTDHEFDPDLLVRMLDRVVKSESTTDRIDVLTGLYRFRHPPCTPVLFVEGKPIIKWPKDAIFTVGAAGAGCLLIMRTVFNAIEASGEAPFDRMPGLSEDHSFFARVKKLGIKAWCDPRIECHHLRVDPVTEETGDLEVGEMAQVEGVAH